MTGSDRRVTVENRRAAARMVAMAKPYRLGPGRRVVNVVVAKLVPLGIGGKSTYLLTTTGRRTGEKRTTPVILAETGGDRWLVSPYGQVGWVQNVRARPEVSLRRGKRTETLGAEEGSAEAAGPILRRYHRYVRVTVPFFDAGRDDPVERFVEEASRHPVFKLIAAPT
jgi:deazaflavin-dependent oxidoreductase (nitroreductase family)